MKLFIEKRQYDRVKEAILFYVATARTYASMAKAFQSQGCSVQARNYLDKAKECLNKTKGFECKNESEETELITIKFAA